MRDIQSYIVSANDLPDGTVNQNLWDSQVLQYHMLQGRPLHYLKESVEHGDGDRLASGKKLLPDNSQQLHRAQKVLKLPAKFTEGARMHVLPLGGHIPLG